MKRISIFVIFLFAVLSSRGQFEGVLTYQYGIGTSINYIKDNWSFIQFIQEDKDTLLFWYEAPSKILYTQLEKNVSKLYKTPTAMTSLNLNFEALDLPIEDRNGFKCLQGKLREDNWQEGQSEFHVWYIPGKPEPAALAGLFKSVPGIPVFVSIDGRAVCELIEMKNQPISKKIYDLSSFSIIEISDEFIDIKTTE
ncbi:MAG: hypothetical protein RL092_17 [Bacteroidota bacterium]|jgi:hypothetical protein